MPLYPYRCTECGAEEDAFNSVSNRESGAPECHGKMVPYIVPVRGHVAENCHYVCPQTGQQVTSWRQRKNILAEHNLVDARDIDTRKRRDAIKKRRKEREELIKKYDPGLDLSPYMP
jgi:hypothetical protein